jgi:hypothetical protein
LNVSNFSSVYHRHFIVIISSSFSSPFSPLPVSPSSLNHARLLQLQDSTLDYYSRNLCNAVLLLLLALALYILAKINSVPPVRLIAIGDERIEVDL